MLTNARCFLFSLVTRDIELNTCRFFFLKLFFSIVVENMLVMLYRIEFYRAVSALPEFNAYLAYICLPSRFNMSSFI